MDLRVQRTRKNIINAFIELRSKKPLDKITVKELSELAFINKATFYTHYKDIYDLAEQLENEAIDQVVSSISHPEYLITNPKISVPELAIAFRSQNQLFSILFSPPRNSVLIDKLETQLRAKIHEVYPEFKNDLQKDLLITILVQGCFRASLKHPDADFQEIIRIISDINECIITNFR